MHDPSTVAFDIKMHPWRGRKSQFFPKGYRATFITIAVKTRWILRASAGAAATIAVAGIRRS